MDQRGVPQQQQQLGQELANNMHASLGLLLRADMQRRPPEAQLKSATPAYHGQRTNAASTDQACQATAFSHVAHSM